MTKYSATKADDRRELGAGLVDGLRGDAYTVAEDLGAEALKSEEAVSRQIDAMKTRVFPFKGYEAKELLPRWYLDWRTAIETECDKHVPI